MFKRLFWLIIGASLGMGGSWWVTRRVKQAIERYVPPSLKAGANSTATHLRAAVQDGRQAMREREAELRARVDARHPPVT